MPSECDRAVAAAMRKSQTHVVKELVQALVSLIAGFQHSIDCPALSPCRAFRAGQPPGIFTWGDFQNPAHLLHRMFPVVFADYFMFFLCF